MKEKPVQFVKVLLLFAVLSNTASAEWMRFSKDKELSIVNYYNPSTIRELNDRTTIKIVFNLHNPIAVGMYRNVKSIEYLLVFNCRNTTHQVRGISMHSDSLTKGRIIFTYAGTDGLWVAPPINSPFKDAMNIACGEIKKQLRIKMKQKDDDSDLSVNEPK